MIFQIHLDVLIVPLQLLIDRPPKGSLLGMNFRDHESTSVTIIKNVKTRSSRTTWNIQTQEQTRKLKTSQICKISKFPQDVKIVIMEQCFHVALRNFVDDFDVYVKQSSLPTFSI